MNGVIYLAASVGRGEKMTVLAVMTVCRRAHTDTSTG